MSLPRRARPSVPFDEGQNPPIVLGGIVQIRQVPGAFDQGALGARQCAA